MAARNRAGAGVWNEAELSAWRAARQDDGVSLPKPFGFPAGPVFSCSEGEGGIPLGLLWRAFGIHWRILAASKWHVWVELIFMVEIRGEEEKRIRSGIAGRAALDSCGPQREPTEGPGYPGCDGCTPSHKCIRCTFCEEMGTTAGEEFAPPTPPTATFSECYAAWYRAKRARLVPRGV